MGDLQSHEFTGNVAILNEQLRRESWYNTFWSRFSGEVGIDDDNGNPKYTPSGKPIEILNGFKAQGRDNMLVPFLTDLGDNIKYGDSTLKGTGDTRTMKWLRVYVNQWRTAVKAQTGRMDAQRAKLYKLYEEAKPALSRRIAKYYNQFVYQTLYYGSNSPIYAPTTGVDGIGLLKRLHPNWYYSKSTTTTNDLTAVGTEHKIKTTTNMSDAVTALTASTSTGKMDSNLLEELRVKAMELLIPQMVSQGGVPYWVMIVHPSQGKDLRADTTFGTAQRTAFTGQMLKSPELNGSIGYYAGFAIFEDIVGIRGWNVTSHDLYNDGVFSLSTATNYNAVIVGNSAIGKSVASSTQFTNEKDDHDNIVEIGSHAIDGFGRTEFYADGDIETVFAHGGDGGIISGKVAENTSSMIVMTA